MVVGVGVVVVVVVVVVAVAVVAAVAVAVVVVPGGVGVGVGVGLCCAVLFFFLCFLVFLCFFGSLFFLLFVWCLFVGWLVGLFVFLETFGGNKICFFTRNKLFDQRIGRQTLPLPKFLVFSLVETSL